MVKVTSLLLRLEVELGEFWRKEMEIRCVKGIYRLNLVSGEKNSGSKQ